MKTVSFVDYRGGYSLVGTLMKPNRVFPLLSVTRF